jgi:TRAP-type C4-dicarboxylate transport system substrate-binding protein
LVLVVEMFHTGRRGATTERIDQARTGASVGAAAEKARLSAFAPSLAIKSAPILVNSYAQAGEFAAYWIG